MFESKISAEEVRYVLETGEVIEEYPDDMPYPSRLIVECYNGRLIHVVSADNFDEDEIILITVYEPDPSEWDQIVGRGLMNALSAKSIDKARNNHGYFRA